jgi:uncharacterized membrane-anchored protein YjiN (DUF445 family)
MSSLVSDSAARDAPLRPRSSLARMRHVATALLVLAALLYGAATLLAPLHPAWRYVAAFAEAAMIGGIADWFAVVALFRRPLGLPIPHTAIVPANKARIGRELANFICDNFLATPQVLDKLRTLDPAGGIARWLAQPANAERVGEHLGSVLRYAIEAFDDRRARHFLGQLVKAQLAQVDLSRLAGQVLDVLTAQGRHQALLDEVLQQLAQLLRDEEIQARIADAIASEVKYLRYVGLDAVAGQIVARKMVAGIGRLIGEMGDDPQHELRQRFDRFMTGYVAQLKDDPQMRERGEALKQDILAHPALGRYLQGLWKDVVAWLQRDLAEPESAVAQRLRQAAQGLGTRLQRDEAMRQWINDQVMAAAPSAIERYREDIRRYIAGRVDAWDTAEMTRELERNIGRDLQYVRLNGTLVGGLIGLAIYSATQWLR